MLLKIVRYNRDIVGIDTKCGMYFSFYIYLIDDKIKNMNFKRMYYKKMTDGLQIGLIMES
jgi:hypothetical protein